MNKDLIIKLAKLANNNPNENEANAAARKVCRLLAEANFDFNSTERERPQTVVFSTEQHSNWDWFNDIVQNARPYYKSDESNYQDRNQTTGKKDIHPCPKCGRKSWLVDILKNCYNCPCGQTTISAYEADFNQWRMT